MLLLCAAIALAHGDAGPHSLGGTVLCLDPASLRVAVEGLPTPERSEAFLRARLEEGVAAAVERYRLPFERRDSCDPDARLTLRLDARASAPAVTEYLLAVEVAAVAGAAPRFVMRLRSLHDEAVATAPYLVQLPRYSAAMMTDLAQAWWEDNPVVRPTKSWLPPLLGGALASVVLLVGLWWRRRRGAHSGGISSPYDGA